MTDGPTAREEQAGSSIGPKPSIGEVAAWLRRAAEDGESVEDLAPDQSGGKPPADGGPAEGRVGDDEAAEAEPGGEDPARLEAAPSEPVVGRLDQASDEEEVGAATALTADRAGDERGPEPEPEGPKDEGPKAEEGPSHDISDLLGHRPDARGDDPPAGGPPTESVIDRTAEREPAGPTSRPVDLESPDGAPADARPAEEAPPKDAAPGGESSAGEASADTASADTTPGDTTPADTASADTTPADTASADTASADTASADTAPADTAPADKVLDEAGRSSASAEPEAHDVQDVVESVRSRWTGARSGGLAQGAAAREIRKPWSWPRDRSPATPAVGGPTAPVDPASTARRDLDRTTASEPEPPTASEPGAPTASDPGPALADDGPTSSDDPGQTSADDGPPTALGRSTTADSGTASGGPGPSTPADRGPTSLFDLDLAELAARARASAAIGGPVKAPPFDSRAPSQGPAPTRVEPQPTEDEPVTTEVEAVPADVAAVPGDSVAGPGDSVADGPRDRPTGHLRPKRPAARRPVIAAISALDLSKRPAGEQVTGDVEMDEQAEAGSPAKKAAPRSIRLPAGLRSTRPRYPRGQLRERIGLLRRVRAMLGVVVVTVLLGIAAGAAIGGFLLFLAFAIRGAIISG